MVKTKESILLRREKLARSQPDEAGSTERVRKLNARMLAKRPGICLHRARAFTEVFSQTEGEPSEIRFAKAFTKTLQELPAIITEGELIVGAPTCQYRAAGFFPETAGAWLRNEIDTLSNRQWDPYDVTPEQVKEIKKIMPYWQGKTLFDIWSKACPPAISTKVIHSSWADSTMSLFTSGFHFTPPWELILKNGICWYEAKVKEALANIDYANPEQMGKEHFYQALLLVITAAKNFANKYSQKARELADQEPDPKRKKELVCISEMTARVPYYGARSFYEAVQSVCFLMALLYHRGYRPGLYDRSF